MFWSQTPTSGSVALGRAGALLSWGYGGHIGDRLLGSEKELGQVQGLLFSPWSPIPYLLAAILGGYQNRSPCVVGSFALSQAQAWVVLQTPCAQAATSPV